MELNITAFINRAVPSDYSASVIEKGGDAANITWRNAIHDSDHFALLTTDEQREAFRKYTQTFGAWTDEDIAAWNDAELNALCIQMIAGEMRDADMIGNDPKAWEKYNALVEAGQVAGNLCRNDDGTVYFTFE